ncbi:MAG: glutamate ligase domain-containing protein [Flavobacteriales bacterium]
MEQKTRNASARRLAAGQLVDARRAAIGATGPHRLEAVAELDGVAYVNDSRATFIDAALESLGMLERPLVWVAGAWGDQMRDAALQGRQCGKLRAVVLFGPLEEAEGERRCGWIHRVDSVRTAVFAARELARPGDAVLFSPACPSGCGFANYEERGAAFKRAVRDLERWMDAG